MKKLFIFLLLLAPTFLWAQNTIVLDLKAAVDDGTYDLDAENDKWVETYNPSTNTLSFNGGMFNFSHIPGLFGGEDVGGGMSYWDGFTLCQNGDTNDYGILGNSDGWVSQQWGCMAGGGLNERLEAERGRPYLVAYWGYYYETDDVHACRVDFDGELHKVRGVYVCNHPWPYYGNIHGDGFAGAFEAEGDIFTLTAHGLLGGEDTGSQVTITLAENTGDGVEREDGWPAGLVQSSQWQWMDLEELGEVDGVYFTMYTTDADPIYGPNTAVYFCLDRMEIYPAEKTGLPSRPHSLTAEEIGEDYITLVWAKADDAQSWQVYLNDSLVAEVEDTVFVYTGLAPYQEYSLKVVARNYVGLSDAASITAKTIDRTPPTKPENLTAEALSPYSVKIEWSPSQDNVDVLRYRVYIDEVEEARPKQCAYTLTGLEPETEYIVSVEAVDASGNVSERAELTVKTLEDPLAVNSLAASEDHPLTIRDLQGQTLKAASQKYLPSGIYIINHKKVRIH